METDVYCMRISTPRTEALTKRMWTFTSYKSLPCVSSWWRCALAADLSTAGAASLLRK